MDNENKNGQETGRVTSIARKINRQYVWEKFCTFFWWNLILLLLLTAVFIYQEDRQNLGRFSWSYLREIGWDEIWYTLPNGNQGMVKNMNMEDPLLKEGDFPLEDMWYRVTAGAGTTGEKSYKIPIGLWLSAFGKIALVILILEIIDLTELWSKGARKVRRKLKPLNEMAAKAQTLSELAFDETKYHDLENAISSLKVETPDAHIHMSDRDLEGIETALNDLIDRMRESYKQQTRFVSDASHELRTPIAVIQGYVNMLDRWGKEDEAILEEAIEAIKNESAHMQRLVEQLLFLARGDSGRQNLEMKPVNLNEVMREVYEESLMIDEKHQYIFEENGQAQMIGDSAMLKQSARILIDNAAKYTPEQEIIQIRVGVQQDGAAYYGIQDNGIGMSENDVSHVFDRFYRADAVRNSQTGGTGLGLSIAKWIVERHIGYYNVISREGLGTRFTVIFPQNK